MSTINTNDYQYICYVDASGNDGEQYDKNNSGSSVCFAVACFIMEPKNFEYNLKLFKDIKTIMHVPENGEVKYKTLRKHKNKDEVIKILKKVKGFVISSVFYKKMLKDEFYTNLKEKNLTSFCHTFSIKETLDLLDGKTLVVIDRMKEIEMENISLYFDDKNEVIFRDSKDVLFPFLQFADLFAGIIRNYFEEYETCEVHKGFSIRCKMCSIVKRLCKHNKKQIAFMKNKDLYQIRNVFYQNSGRVINNGIILNPIKNGKAYLHFDCFEKYK